MCTSLGTKLDIFHFKFHDKSRNHSGKSYVQSCLGLLDRERFAWRGLQHHPRCLLCDQTTETIQHLLLTCPFARQTWHAILSWLRLLIQAPDQEPTVMAWWLRANEHTLTMHRKALRSITLLVPWWSGNTGTRASLTMRHPRSIC